MTFNPQNPFQISVPPGNAPSTESGDRGGALYDQQYHGKYYPATYYGRLYNFNLTGKTIPVIAATLASVFTIYNPPTSTVNAELVSIDIGLVLATTVVDTVGLYWQSTTLASLATLTTIGVFNTNWFSGQGNGNAGQVNPYSAFTHSGTPVRVDIIDQFGAVTATNDAPIHKEYDGKRILPPGHVWSVAMSTAAGFTAGQDISADWMEVNTI